MTLPAQLGKIGLANPAALYCERMGYILKNVALDGAWMQIAFSLIANAARDAALDYLSATYEI